MSAHYSGDHVGRFIAQSTHDTEIEITGVTLDDAHAAITELQAHRSPTVTTDTGRVYLIDGLHFICGYWTPEPSR